MTEQVKNWLNDENARNKRNRALYSAILNQAYPQCRMTLIMHHLSFQLPGHEPQEIPAADTLLFCRDIMQRCFGADAEKIMVNAATVMTARDRDDYVKQEFEARFGEIEE